MRATGRTRMLRITVGWLATWWVLVLWVGLTTLQGRSAQSGPQRSNLSGSLLLVADPKPIPPAPQPAPPGQPIPPAPDPPPKPQPIPPAPR